MEEVKLDQYKKKIKNNESFEEIKKLGSEFMQYMQKNQEFKDDLLEKLNIDVDILFNQDHPKFKTLYTEVDPNK